MKKGSLMILLFMIVILSCFSSVSADEYEKPILFKNIPWGTPYKDVIETLQVTPSDHFWDWTPGGLGFEVFDEDFVYSGSYGLAMWIEPSEIKDNKVAGYPINAINLYFVYTRDENGEQIQDKDHAVLASANYSIIFWDGNGLTSADAQKNALEDLQNKLTKVYGDIDREFDSDDQYGAKSAWYGADGTLVALVCSHEDWGENSPDSIYIKYSFEGLDDLLGLAVNIDPDDIEGL